MIPKEFQGLLGSLQSIRELILPQLKAQMEHYRGRIAKEMPDFLGEYDNLVKDVLEKRKGSNDIAEFMRKYEHVLKSKQSKNDFNRK